MEGTPVRYDGRTPSTFRSVFVLMLTPLWFFNIHGCRALDSGLKQFVEPVLSSRSQLGSRPVSLLEEERGWQTESLHANSSETSGAADLNPSPHSTIHNTPVTLAILDQPVLSLLLKLASRLSLDLHIDEEVSANLRSNSVTLNIQNRPLSQLLDNLASQATFRWQLEEGQLSIMGDDPYLEVYSVNYLNLSRTTNSSVGLATQVGSINLAIDSAGNGGKTNNSETLISNSATHDFWARLSQDLTQLLEIDADSHHLIVNREAGLVSVRARQHRHNQVRRYLDKVQKSINRQVMIEATIVEVSLSNDYRSGVDWALLASDGGVSWSQNLNGVSLPEASGDTSNQATPSALLGFVRDTAFGSLSATLDVLSRFGDVRILSRPQIIALNNQSAVLKVVDNRVYFSVNVERKSTDSGDDISTSTKIHTVPVGLVMNVIPFISDRNDVVLNIRPTISRILGFVDDPNPELNLTNVKSGVPEIQVREMESVLRMKDGQVVVIGGLMQEQSSNSTAGVPGLAALPWLGGLFRKNSDSSGKTELLVFLKPTVISPSDADTAALSR